MTHPSFTHFDEHGRPHMVDISDKAETDRMAHAEAWVTMRVETMRLIQEGGVRKGDVLQVAQLAGVMAAKKTADWIPLCHPLPLTSVQVSCEWMEPVDKDSEIAQLRILSVVKTTYRTGVEMEALTACSCAALTVYDMCKSVDRSMEIGPIRLMLKSGGNSGHFSRQA